VAFLEIRPTQTLYKYCSIDGFLGIVRSKRLWFSDLALANDPRELKMGFELFEKALDLVRGEEPKGERAAFLSTLAKQLANAHAVQQAFCCCFSLVADELPMWNAYAQNYSGVAIGFRPTSLLSIPCRVQKVRYLKNETIEEFKGVVLSLIAQFHTLGHTADDLNFWIPATVAAFAAITALKHQSWSYEQEVRWVYAQKRKEPDPRDGSVSSTISYWPDGKLIKWAKPLKRIGADGSVEYMEFPFGKFHRGACEPERAIKSVTLGPKCALSPLRRNGRNG
jgi:hypothetical protein